MYLALCLLALVPAIYQTVITKLITSFASPGSLDIIGQMEWYDLIDETICAFLIVPMYSVLSKAYKKEGFNRVVFKSGLIVVVLYALFNIGTFFFGIHMVSFMNPNEIDIGAAYRYLSLETIAFMIGIVFSFVSVVFLVIDKPKYMYAFLVAKILLSLLSDLALVPGMGVDGIAIGNIIANTIMGGLGIALLILAIVNIVTGTLINIWSGKESFNGKKMIKGIAKVLAFYVCSVFVAIAFTMLPFINEMITNAFGVILLSSELLNTLSSVAILGIVISTITNQGKKAINGILELSKISIKED